MNGRKLVHLVLLSRILRFAPSAVLILNTYVKLRSNRFKYFFRCCQVLICLLRESKRRPLMNSILRLIIGVLGLAVLGVTITLVARNESMRDVEKLKMLTAPVPTPSNQLPNGHPTDKNCP